MSKAIGIDLGSTLSEIAIIENGKATVLVNEEGSNTTPSVVSLSETSPKVGGGAKRQMLMKPKETINLIKRFMGGTYADVQDAINHVRYDVVNKEGKPYIHVNDRDYSPEEISSFILAKMKKVAEDYLGEEVKEAVITVPAFFSDNAKAATKTAGELAGLKVLRILSEPTSALLASNIDKNKNGKYLVVDFGGSTLDNSVAEIGDGVVEILASYGDVYLGGSDIDNEIAKYLIDTYKVDSGIDLSNDTLAMPRIYEAAEKAKIELSSSSMTEINLPYISVKDNVPQHLNISLTKAKFEQLVKPIVDRAVNCGVEALKKANITANDIDGVLLVGGSCRVPLVQEELIKAFGDKLIKNTNLDLAVAEGAAIQADIIATGGKNSDILLLDVTPLGLGIETEGGVMTQIIEPNTTIPCKRSQIFSTAVDNQSAVTIAVLQGERPMARDNKMIGMFNLDGITPARRGVPKIEVTFDVDVNGLLTVTAVDKATGKEQHVTIENKNSLSQEEIDRIKAEAKEHEAEDERVKKEIETKNKVDGCIYQTESQLESMKDHLTEDDKTFFNGKIDELKKMQSENVFTNADSVINEVTQRWYTVSAKAYGQNNDGNGQSSMNAQDFMNMFTGAGGPFGGFNPNSQNSSTPNDKGKKDEEFEEVK